MYDEPGHDTVHVSALFTMLGNIGMRQPRTKGEIAKVVLKIVPQFMNLFLSTLTGA